MASAGTPNEVFPKIQKGHLVAAIVDLDRGRSHRFGRSQRYDVRYNGRAYPPKAVVGLAAAYVRGQPFGPYDFKGGLETRCFAVLARHRFKVVDRITNKAIKADRWLTSGVVSRRDDAKLLAELHREILGLATRIRVGIRGDPMCIAVRPPRNRAINLVDTEGYAVAIGSVGPMSLELWLDNYAG